MDVKLARAGSRAEIGRLIRHRCFFFFFSSRRRHTRCLSDWSSDVCSSDLGCMARSLVIVESPAKAKTINKFLGKGFVVKASMGHVRDLPKKTLGVDEKDFTPTYLALPEKKKTLAELKKAAKDADAIFLAADPDREGEAICWHLKEELSKDTKVDF